MLRNLTEGMATEAEQAYAREQYEQNAQWWRPPGARDNADRLRTLVDGGSIALNNANSSIGNVRISSGLDTTYTYAAWHRPESMQNIDTREMHRQASDQLLQTVRTARWIFS